MLPRVIGSPGACFCLAISRVPSYRPALVIIRVLVRVLARHRVIVLKGLVTQTGIEGAVAYDNAATSLPPGSNRQRANRWQYCSCRRRSSIVFSTERMAVGLGFC